MRCSEQSRYVPLAGHYTLKPPPGYSRSIPHGSHPVGAVVLAAGGRSPSKDEQERLGGFPETGFESKSVVPPVVHRALRLVMGTGGALDVPLAGVAIDPVDLPRFFRRHRKTLALDFEPCRPVIPK